MEMETFWDQAQICICAPPAPSVVLFLSGGQNCHVFMVPAAAYRAAICKQGIMVSASRPGSAAAICASFGSTPGPGSAEITAVLWPPLMQSLKNVCFHPPIHPSVRPSVLSWSSVTQADGFQCVAGWGWGWAGWSGSSSLTATSMTTESNEKEKNHRETQNVHLET